MMQKDASVGGKAPDIGTLMVMIGIATSASNTMQKQSTWFTAGVAAALTFILTRDANANFLADDRSLTFTIYWLFAALVCGILSMPAHLFATISGNPIPLLKNLPAAPDSNEMEMQLRRAFAPWTRWVFERAATEKGRYDPAILACISAQVHGHLLILQLFCVVVAAGILVAAIV